MKDFVHLHVHTEFSILDGATKTSEVFERCKELGQTALAITDHGNMFATLNFSKLARMNGIKPIVGCELYMCEDLTNKTVSSGKPDHLVLLAKNRAGYRNIILLDSIAYVDGFYGRPRCDYKTLFEHTEGVICLSACLAGKLPRLLLSGNYEAAKKHALEMKSHFGDDYYIELQDHGIDDQKRVNPLLIKLARELDIGLVATNDVHYIRKEDAKMQEVMLCINTKKTMDDPTRMRFETDEFYLKDGDQMFSLFENVPEAIENTVKIAEKCVDSVFEFNKDGSPKRDASLTPMYTPPDGKTQYEYLREIAERGLQKKYPEITETIRTRFEYELKTIADMGFLDYYLIVWDYINYAKENDIPVGPGRGSGVGSIIAYSMGITDVEPLQYDLLFERFLNRERVSMPDFDVDFCTDRRQEVIEYARKKYGYDNVAQIATFGTMASKAAIKDVARVYKIPFNDVNRITKLLDGKSSIAQSLGLKLGKHGESLAVKDLVEIYESDETLKMVIDMAMKLEGMPRNISMHAAGVVICNKVIKENVPLARSGEDIVTQFNMVEIEQLGMLKMDFLALRTLTDIKKACDYIYEQHGVKIDFNKIGYSEKVAYDLISSGDTDAVFQLESGGMKKFMRDLKPNNLEDIIAGISLYRPGPMDSIPQYMENRANPDKIVYKHPMLESILKVTSGTIIYQEQVMAIVQKMAGYTLGQADIIRRVMSKKKAKEMEKQKQLFIYGEKDENGNIVIEGAVYRGVPEDVARDIFEEMESFASYAFNKSHAAAYAVLAYQTAYLKALYPQEFLAAILNNRIDSIEEITKYVLYLKERGIKVLPPDINKSKQFFSVENGCVRIGLVALKGVGHAAIKSIIEEREENGDYKSFEDFISRVDKTALNKRLVENMIYAGVFDCFKIARSKLICVSGELIDRASLIAKQRDSEQLSFFGTMLEETTLEVNYPEVSEYDLKHKLMMEKEVLGVYVSGHPLENYIDKFKRFNFSLEALDYFEEDEDGVRTYPDLSDGQQVSMGGMITAISKKTTKTGQSMAFITLEDAYNQIEGVLFPKVYDRFKDKLEKDAIVVVYGKIQLRDEEKPSLCVDKLEIFTENDKQEEVEIVKPKTKRQFICVVLNDDTVKDKDEIIETLIGYPGEAEVYFKIDGKNYRMTEKCRVCKGLIAELTAFVDKDDILIKEID
ncbi:MAG: DNA polymerase III subunit alpha [Clostridia bacterium]|nr:DNA polymerase III subunit alpha [Clostridia bacterium]